MPTERKADRVPASELGPTGPVSSLWEGGPPVLGFHPVSGGKRGMLALEGVHWGPAVASAMLRGVPAAAQTPLALLFSLLTSRARPGFPPPLPTPVTPSSLPFDVFLIEI